jgi:hypothetical protein
VIACTGEPVKVTAYGHIIHPGQVADIGKVMLYIFYGYSLVLIGIP